MSYLQIQRCAKEGGESERERKQSEEVICMFPKGFLLKYYLHGIFGLRFKKLRRFNFDF